MLIKVLVLLRGRRIDAENFIVGWEDPGYYICPLFENTETFTQLEDEPFY